MSDRVVQLQRTLPSGWSLGMYLIPLGNGELLVHSPTWLGPKTFEQIEAHGRPRILLAPNHFHHLSLGRYRERYPEARVVAAPAALPRLSKQGHRGLEPLEAVEPDLPEGFRFLVPEGLKNGEVFLSLPGEGGRTWVICDAFFNVPGPMKGPQGLVLRMFRTAPGLCVGFTFWWLGVRSVPMYLGWLERTLAEEQPNVALFSHGAPLAADDLAPRLYGLAKRRLS